MFCVQLQWFVLAFFLIYSIQCEQLCDFEDFECMTKVANKIHNAVTGGFEGIIESGDPLSQDKINGETETAEYELTNATLSGLANCKVPLLKCNTEESTYEYHMDCPKLIISTNFDANGTVGLLELNDKGDTVFILNDYKIIVKGKYGKLVSEKDHKPHIFVVPGYNVESKANGPITFEHVNLYTGDAVKSEQTKKYMNENWRESENAARYIIKTFIDLHFKNIDFYLRARPLDEVFEV